MKDAKFQILFKNLNVCDFWVLHEADPLPLTKKILHDLKMPD